MNVLPSRLKIRPLPSPHHRSRKDVAVGLIVIHSISCPPGRFGTGDIERLFLGTLDCDSHPAYEEVRGEALSSHFLIDRRGRVTQFVDTERAAFHAGASSWKGRRACNDFSVGIELEGTEGRPFTQRQYGSLARLCRDLMGRYPGITRGRVTGHSDVAPGRKTDPGPLFDWALFHSLLAKAAGERQR
jgi:AmpD protein